MGDIVQRGTKDRPRFYARFVDIDGKRKQRAVKGAATIADAQKILAAIELNVTEERVGLLPGAQNSRATDPIRRRAINEARLASSLESTGLCPLCRRRR